MCCYNCKFQKALGILNNSLNQPSPTFGGKAGGFDHNMQVEIYLYSLFQPCLPASSSLISIIILISRLDSCQACKTNISVTREQQASAELMTVEKSIIE